jgi:hypothetical protein
MISGAEIAAAITNVFIAIWFKYESFAFRDFSL